MAEEETWEALAKRLTALVVKLDERNERLDGWIAGQADINERLAGAIERIDRTLTQVALSQADMQRLLTRIIPTGENGREA